MKKAFSFFLLFFAGDLIFACTTFCINKNGQIFFGRNYDWITGAGIVNTNQRGLFKTSMKASEDGTISWVSKFGSITFNQYGKEFPTGGMNEKGLVVELMWLDGTKYPEPDSRPSIGVLQWIQYQMDNASKTAEVIASDALIRITTSATPLHYLVADADGNIATIEFLNGKMTIHKNEDLPFPVLTNDTYASCAQAAKTQLSKQNEIFLQNNSLERFVKACSMINKIIQPGTSLPLTDYAFSILDNVAQGNFTKWSIVYDITGKKIHFKTADHKDIKIIRFSAFDLACDEQSKMFNMKSESSGDISDQFTASNKIIKQQVMDQVILESSSRVTITRQQADALLNYEEGVSCKQ
ncbi:MAG: linear amide C-N hydrolase [Ferruginibacter sp.]